MWNRGRGCPSATCGTARFKDTLTRATSETPRPRPLWKEVKVEKSLPFIKSDQQDTLADKKENVLKPDSLSDDTQPKPLKINRDLLLYKAKNTRQRGTNSASKQKKEMWLQKSEEIFRRVLDMDPTDARAYVGLGKLFVGQRRYSDARKMYEDGCSIAEGKNPYIWTAWGNLEFKQKKYNLARSYFEAATVANQKHEAAWHSWGEMEKTLGNFEAARNCWINGIRYADGRPSPYFYQSLAQLAAKLEFYDEARVWYRKGTQYSRGNRNYVLWTSWATMEDQIGDRAVVKKMFEKSFELNPGGRYASLTWGRINEEAGETEMARELFLKGHQKNKFDPALLQALGMLESKEGNYGLARSYFRASLDVDENHQYTWQAWGLMEFRLGNFDEARRLFQQGVWANPSSSDAAYIFHAWGNLEEAANNPDVARILYACGVKVDPRSEVLWTARVLLEENCDQFDRANDLRNYSLQQRREIVLPRNFSTLDEPQYPFKDFLTKFTDWLARRSDEEEDRDYASDF